MSEIPEGQAFIDALTSKYFGDPEPKPPNGNGNHAGGDALALSDQEIIDRCHAAKNAAKFASLFDDGDTSAHGYDDSRADMALASMLAFYTDDTNQIDRLFRRSALIRPKWDERRGAQTYGRGTINAVLTNPNRYRYRYRYRVDNAVTPDELPQDSRQKTVEIASVDFAEMNEPGPRETILNPLVAKGWPTIFFGGAGVAKTIIALSLGQAIVDPETERWIAWPVTTCPVVYLDLELNAEEQARRAYRIARGNGLVAPPRGLRYMTTFGVPHRKRGNMMRRALEECEHHGAGVLFIDSLGLALMGNPSDPTDIIAWFDDELAEFAGAGVTVIMIDHQRRLQPGEKSQFLGVFGSVYKENLARSMVQIELVRRDRAEHSITARLRPKKANFEELAEPVDVKTVFTEDRIHLYQSQLETEHKASEETLSAAERVLAAVVSLGEAAPDEITEACGTLTRSTVKKELSRLRGQNKVEDTGNHGPTGARKVRAVTVTDTYEGNGNDSAGERVGEAF